MDISVAILGVMVVIMTTVSVLLSIKIFILRQRVMSLAVSLTKVEEIFNSTKKEESDSDVHKENFIKFLSDSRDWAYQYIEDVQSGLNKFVDTVDADISYFDKYGDALSMERPDYPFMKNISKAYKELKTLLPVEEKEWKTYYYQH